MQYNIASLTNFCHFLLSNHICKGDIVIDATVGNGNDTIFLSKLVGDSGIVYGFDIQEKAINKTLLILKNKSLNNNVKLFKDSHENIDLYINEKVNACMFNLGYLPGSDKKIITETKSTIKAIKKAMHFLKSKGIITILSYRIHSKGLKEYKQICKFLKTLNINKFYSSKYKILNSKKFSPIIFLIQKV